jgi:tRNA(fMet)-specific endonuclease VapC
MGLIIDTSVFIRWERAGRAIDFSPWSGYGEVTISSITASELLVGVWRADTDSRRQKRTAFVEAILAVVPVVDFNLPVARLHAQLFASLMKSGRTIGPHDLIIAATALHRGSSLLTANAAEFSQVPGLDVIITGG